MKVGIGGVPPLKFVLFLVLMLVVGLASGKISVDISKYLTTYFDLLEKSTGIPETNRMQIAKFYNDGKAMSQAKDVTLKEVAQVLISVEEGSAIIGHGQTCNLTNQDLVDNLYAGNWNDKPFGDTFNHFVKLDNSNTQFCNFFAYLRCQHTSKDPVNPHQCLCPPEMIWQFSKCVFKTGERCTGSTYPLHGRTYKVMPAFDFKKKDFTRLMSSKCQNPSTCRHGESITCEVDEDFNYYATPDELSSFLRGHIDALIPGTTGYADRGPKLDILRNALRRITDRSKQPFYRALSLEVKTTTKLKEHGEACDSARETPIEALLKDYNVRESPDSWNTPDMARDTLRIQYQKRILDDKIDVCNHFKYLHCTTSTPATCDCKDNLVYDSLKKACTVKHNYLCNHYESKIFKPSIIGTLDLSYFTYENINCEPGTGCERIGNIGSFCVKSGTDLVDMFSTQLEFEKKFSIEVNDKCNVADQTELFEDAKKFDKASDKNLNDAKTAIQALTTKSSGYCRIRQHAACSPEGNCTCIPPTKMMIDSTDSKPRCALPNNYRCDRVHKSQLHLDLEKLNLPLSDMDEVQIQSDNELFCVTDSTCEPNYHLHTPGHLCTCALNGKFGDLCDKDSSPHLAYLSVSYLPEDMRTPEGLKIISDLHDPLTQLEAAMTLKYEDTCDKQTNSELVSVMDFLESVRVECSCYWELNSTYKANGFWICNEQTCGKNDSKIQKSMFEVVLQNASTLVSKSPLALCNWNQGFRCLNGKCGCNEDSYYEHQECRAELGSPCHTSLTIDEAPIPMAICRDGLQCAEPQKTTNRRMCVLGPCKSGRYNCYDVTTTKYVSAVKKVWKQKLKAMKTELKKFQNQGWNDTCNPADEKNVKEILVVLEDYTQGGDERESWRDFGDDGDYGDYDHYVVDKAVSAARVIQKNRQDIRLYQGVVKKVGGFPKVDVCHRLFKCSDKTNKCYRDKTRYTPYYATGSTRFLDITALTLNFVVFNLVHFYALH